MSEARLPTGLWVRAHVRQLSVAGTPVYITHRGPEEAGSVLVKVTVIGTGTTVYTQARDLTGRLGWLAAFDGRPVPETEADTYIARAIDRDPDLWVVEIEGRDGRLPFEGPVL